MKFIDHTILSVKAGNGGMGCIAFLREKYRPKGGPSGGNGGHGGNIIFRVNSQLCTLQDITLKHSYRAENGTNGSGNNKHGKNGKDTIIEVPPGTIIKNANSEQILKDLTNNKESYIAAKGGNGGFGNLHFKTQMQTAPRTANDGQKGKEIKIELELKVLADVGLVGFPNAGKSTFISKVSNAKPKIADYPFTTLVPNLGIVKYGEYQSFVLADIPGLINGAAGGKGLGSHFLRHVDRTKAIVYMIECTSENIEKDFTILQNELREHNPILLEHPSLLLLTKIDLIQPELINLKKLSKKVLTIQISSIKRENINQAVQSIAKLIMP